MTLAVCTTVVGRWEKLRRCLQAITADSKQPDEIFVLDNSDNPGCNAIFEEFDVTVLTVEEQIGPSEARQMLIEETVSDRIFFIDSDVRTKSDSIKRLYNQLDETEYQATAGIWSDYGDYYRRVGNSLLFDHKGKNVLKQPISYRDVQELESLEVEFSTPQLMAERDFFSEIQFDSNYQFLYEWWDFFMQVRESDKKILCDLNAEFIHEPGGYDGTESTRHENYNPEEDKQYFERKWGYTPRTTAFDDGTYNVSKLNRSLSYIFSTLNMAQKRKL